jgi:hypothetical protein
MKEVCLPRLQFEIRLRACLLQEHILHVLLLKRTQLEDSGAPVFPWHKWREVDQIVAYYQEIKFKDWVHGETGAPMLKAQHPEFELWSQAIHARAAPPGPAAPRRPPAPPFPATAVYK